MPQNRVIAKRQCTDDEALFIKKKKELLELSEQMDIPVVISFRETEFGDGAVFTTDIASATMEDLLAMFKTIVSNADMMELMKTAISIMENRNNNQTLES